MTAHVLLIDDDQALCETLEVGLRKRGVAVSWETSAEEGLLRIGAEEIDVVVTDLNMRGLDGIELCRRVAANRADIPVIVLTAFGSLDTAVAAIRAGAYDFISKPVEMDVLALAIQRAANHRRLREQVKALQREANRTPRFDDLVGDSPAMRAVYDLVDRVADSEASVLITGESGTGKEVVARALHDRSRRADQRFVAINCAAVPEALLESELFGHVRGAFTDAKTSHEGLFAQARGGTIFLDEIGDMPLALQPKLLRVLQERVVRPVGASTETPVDVRVIAATNRDLESAIEEARFREDLYFRVNVIRIPLPPLRARQGDILLIAQHFLAQFAARAGKKITGLAAATAQKLVEYNWPGNVRELQNCMEHAVALARFEEIGVDDLPERIRAYQRSHVLVVSDDPAELVPMEEMERRYVARVLEATAGNKTAAARVLGIDRKRLYRMIERFGLDVPSTENR
jgi:two-component system response regulator HydG